jgi:hypothetical protein
MWVGEYESVSMITKSIAMAENVARGVSVEILELFYSEQG